MSPAWTRTVRLGEVGRGLSIALAPDAEARAALARDLSLRSLPALTAQVEVKPWLDGVEITGRFDAIVEQVCGVSLEPFEQSVRGGFDVRAVPAGSALASVEDGGEVELDPEAADPPDILDGDILDLAAYVTEHLALELDPFPRKPGATFDYVAPDAEDSPFAALRKLRDPRT